MPEQRVSTVASNSGDVVLAREAQEDASVPIGHTGAWEGWKLRHPPFASVDANGTLLLLGEKEGPAVLTVAQLAGGAMGAVDQDAEWFGLATSWAAHDLNQNPRFGELVRWDVVEVLGRARDTHPRRGWQPCVRACFRGTSGKSQVREQLFEYDVGSVLA